MTQSIDELERLYAAAQFTEKLCVSYDELGNEDTRRLYAFLMEGDAKDGVYVCVDEEPWYNADPPSPRLEAVAAAINALPELVAMGREMQALRRDAGNLATALSLGGSIEKVTEVLRIIEAGGPQNQSNGDWNFDMQSAPRQGEVDLVYLSSYDHRYHRAPGCKWGRGADGDEGWLEYRRHPEAAYEDEWQLVPFEPVAWKAILLPTIAALKGPTT